MTSLRALTRLAVRESRLRPWRSLLVIFLILIPTATAVVVSTWLRTGIRSPQEQVVEQMGHADLAVYPQGSGTGDVERVRDALADHPDWTVVEYQRGTALLALPGGGGRQVRPTVITLPFDRPIAQGLLPKIVSGRPPTGPGEVAASQVLLRRLGIGVGDVITPIRPAGKVRVTAVIEERFNTIAGPGLAGRLQGPPSFLVDLPDGVAPASARSLPGIIQTREGLLELARRASSNDMLFLYLYAGLGTAAFGLVLSSALAIGARRQLRSLGVLGANGATPAQAHWLILLQGIVLGTLGALSGIAVGIGLSFAVRPLVERLQGRPEGSIEINAVDYTVIGLLAIAVALVAAWLPARVAARISVLSALGGRRPLTRLGARVPLAGVTVSTIGCLLLGFAAARNGGDDPELLIAVAGAALAIGGLVICAPYLVGLLERAASAASGTLRLAARTVARQRGRTGPTVAAIMAASALAIATGTVVLAQDRRDERLLAASGSGPPLGSVFVDVSSGEVQPTSPELTCSDLAPKIGAALRTVTSLIPTCLDLEFASVRGGGSAAIVEPDELALLGAGRFRAALEDGKAVLVSLRAPGAPPVEPLVGRGPAPARVSVVRADPRPDELGRYLEGHFLMTRATANRLNATRDQASRALLYVRAPEAFTTAQTKALVALQTSDLGADLSTADRDVNVIFQFATPNQRSDIQFVTYAVILPAAVILALLTTLIGLALTAAETRDEQATFIAVGAGPGHRRRQGAWQAFLMATLGSLLAIPGGLIPAAIVLKASDTNRFLPIQVRPPWLILLALLVGLPLIAATCAALLTRGRTAPLQRRPA